MDLLKKSFSAVGFTEKITGAVIDMLYSTGTRLWNVEEDAEKLRRTEKRIRAVLTDAEQRRFVDDDFVKLWLQELRATAFDVDAEVENFAYRLSTMAAVSRMSAAEPSQKRKRLWLNVDLGLRQRWELDAWIARISERLDKIDKGRRRYRFRLQAGDARRTPAPPMQRPRGESGAGCAANPLGRPAPLTCIGLPLGPHEQSGAARQPTSTRRLPQRAARPAAAVAAAARMASDCRGLPPSLRPAAGESDHLYHVGSPGPVAASGRHRHTEVPGMRPAPPASNPPPRQHTSSSRPPRSSSLPASPHASDVGAPGSTVTAQTRKCRGGVKQLRVKPQQQLLHGGCRGGRAVVARAGPGTTGVHLRNGMDWEDRGRELH